MAQPKIYLYSFDEYLETERKADERSELIDGEIYAMAGESGKHGDISANFLGLLIAALRGSECRARTKDAKVKSGALKERFGRGMISYPDLVVICGEPEYHDKFKDVVLNPAVIIEVLSDATEEFDRGVKFMRYRRFQRHADRLHPRFAGRTARRTLYSTEKRRLAFKGILRFGKKFSD